MVDETNVKTCISELLTRYHKLANKESEAEKRTEDFLAVLFGGLGWKWLSSEVTPQKTVRSAFRATRVDYSFRRSGELRPAFYLEAKRFSDRLDNPDHITQAINYGKNSGIRWVVLTNFARWRIFNSDFFDEPEHAELFEFEISACLANPECMRWLLLFCRDADTHALDDYAKSHKKWKESADIEELLTEQLIEARKILSQAIKEQNLPKFDTGQDMDAEIDKCVQSILDRIIFCRMLEDSGGDAEHMLRNVYERWEKGDRRVQFYKEVLCPLFSKMHDKYDSTIFDQDRIDRLSIGNKEFVDVLKKFYEDPKTGLKYSFDAIATDVLGHAYENYLSWKSTVKRKGLEHEGLFSRKQGGVYYTPEFLVDFLVRKTLGEKLEACNSPDEALRLRVLDPACGSGTFLVRALQEFRLWFILHERKNGNSDLFGSSGLPDFLDSVLSNCLYGIDIDSRAVRLARLNLFLRAVDTPKQLPQLNIIERDSITWEDTEEGNRRVKGFKMPLDFPLVAESGGFDVVIGNPPWEKWKPNSQEFFEEHDEGFRKLAKQQANKRKEELFRTRPYLKKSWNEAVEHYEHYSTLYRNHYRFQSASAEGRQVSGDLDLYKIFTERAYRLCRPGGAVGFVVPSGVYTDLGAKGLRTLLFDHCTLTGLYSFENRGHAIFPDVHASYKFVLLTFEKGGKTDSFPCAFFLHSSDDLKRAAMNPTLLTVDFVRKSSPTAWSVLEIKSPEDMAIVQKLLRHPPLGREIAGSWNITMGNGFHMTNDSHLFQTGKLVGIPLLEGKNIEQFTHQWKEAPVARYKVYKEDILKNIKPEKLYHRSYWLGFRDIASSTNYRTLLLTIVPPGYVCGNTINFVYNLPLKTLAYLCGMLNSFVVDYLIRQKVSAHVNQFYFKEIPLPRLSSGKEFDAIVRKAAQLVCTTEEFSELMKEVGIEKGLTKENERALARAQLDAMVAKVYGLTKEELAFILTKFPNVDGKQKELVLSQY